MSSPGIKHAEGASEVYLAGVTARYQRLAYHTRIGYGGEVVGEARGKPVGIEGVGLARPEDYHRAIQLCLHVVRRLLLNRWK